MKAEVVVIDLLSFLLGISEGIETDTANAEADLAELELVPPSESIAFREQVKKAKVPLKARIVPPDHRMH